MEKNAANSDRNDKLWLHPPIWKSAALCIVYFVTAYLGLHLSPLNGFAALIWPPTGIALVLVYLWGFEVSPAIFAGALAINLIQGAPASAAFGIAIGNTLEALLGIYFLKRRAHFRSFDHLIDVFGFIVYAALSTFAAAIVGVASLWAGGVITAPEFVSTWWSWWVGDMLGALIVGGVSFAWISTRTLKETAEERQLEWAGAFSLLAALTVLIFTGFFGDFSRILYPYSYFLFIPLVWIAMRFGTRGISAGVLFVAVFSIWMTLIGRGPFGVTASTAENLLALQIFMGTLTTAGFVIAASSSERSAIQEEVEYLNDELRRRLGELEAIWGSIGTGIIAIDNDGAIFRINNVAAELLGTSVEEAQGKKIWDIEHLEDESGARIPFGQSPIMHALRGEKMRASLDNTYYARRPDGTMIPLGLVTTPIMANTRVAGAVKVFRDYSREKEIDLFKSEFLSIAAHQLRTPLSIIGMYSELLRRESRDAGVSEKRKNQVQYATEIFETSARMARLLNNLLQVARIEAKMVTVEHARVNIAEIARTVLAELDRKIQEKSQNIEINFSKNLPECETDAELLHVVLENLVSNAVKYTPENGTISLSFAPKEKAVVMTISDTGRGIPANQKKEVFKKLFRADNVRHLEVEGTGLGLYIVKSIVEYLGGDISLESEENVGTTVAVTLPLSAPLK